MCRHTQEARIYHFDLKSPTLLRSDMAKQGQPSGGSWETCPSIGHSAERGWVGQAERNSRMDSTLLSLGQHSQQFADVIVICLFVCLYISLKPLTRTQSLDEENFWMWIIDPMALPPGPQHHIWEFCNSLCTKSQRRLSWGACWVLDSLQAAQPETCSLPFAFAIKWKDLLAGYLFIYSSPRY